MNSVSFKDSVSVQRMQPTKETILPEKEEIIQEADSQKSNATKLMVGATALAAAVIGGVLLHNGLAARRAAKQAFQEGLNATEHIHIKETPASRNAQAMINRVENLKIKENSPIKIIRIHQWTGMQSQFQEPKHYLNINSQLQKLERHI